MKKLFLSLFTGFTMGSAVAVLAKDGQSFKQNLQEAFDCIETHMPGFDYSNIAKCMKHREKQDCFSAMDDLQVAKMIFKNEKNISKFDKDLTIVQYSLLKLEGNTATVEDLLRFLGYPAGQNISRRCTKIRYYTKKRLNKEKPFTQEEGVRIFV